MNEELAPADETLPAAFERAARRHGLRTALVANGWQPTYRELNDTASRLARVLRRHGSAAADRVAILMDHDAPAIAAMVAVLKASCVVVVLDFTQPEARLRQLLMDSEPSLLIADRDRRDLAAKVNIPNCRIVAFEDYETETASEPLPLEVTADQTAFLAYTSGSTGTPKAVMMTHRQFRRNALIQTEAMQYTADDRIPLFGILSAGQAVTLSWCALLNGATLYPFPVILRGIAGIPQWIVDNRITVYISSASIFRGIAKVLPDNFKFSGVRAIRLASEAVTAADFELFRKHLAEECLFVHTLSCSETCNIAVSQRSWHDRVPEGNLAVGLASSGGEVSLLDDEDRPVTPGQVGEIVVKSRYVALGYWRNPELTAERFSDPIDESGTRIVHTGDLGRINSEGLLEFCGRKDNRIKIRGNRVELSEIEFALRRLPAVDHAVVEIVQRANLEPLLIAFVATRDPQWSASSLREALRGSLPQYMVPSTFEVLDRIPFTASGKIDRQRLRQIEILPQVETDDGPPFSETEALLADIWRKTFEIPSVSRDSDFFDLGGDSLIAAVVGARVHAAAGVELNLSHFAEHSTLAGLAACIGELRNDRQPRRLPSLAAIPRDKPLPLSSFQLRAWQGSQTPAGLAAYTGADCYVIRGPLDRQVFGDCLNFITTRHEILRTTISIGADGEPVQVVRPPAPVACPFFDLTDVADAEEQAWQLLRRQAREPIDLERGSLVRHAIVQIHENEHWWLRVAHHAITDAWSSDLFMQELAQLYDARTRGAPPPLAEREPLQYADFADWQRTVFNPASNTYRGAVQWWREYLGGAPRTLVPPCRRLWRIKGLNPDLGYLRWGVTPELSARLHEIGRKQKATFFVVRLAAFVAFLAAATRQRDIVFGTYVSNRTHFATQGMMGFFVNLAILRYRYDESRAFSEFLSSVSADFGTAAAQCGIPYDDLRHALAQEGQPAPHIQIIFTTTRRRNFPEDLDIGISKLDRRMVGMPWSFSINFDENDETSDCRVNFDAGIYAPPRVRSFVGEFCAFLDAVSLHPDLPLAQVAAMSPLSEPSIGSRIYEFLFRLFR